MSGKLDLRVERQSKIEDRERGEPTTTDRVRPREVSAAKNEPRIDRLEEREVTEGEGTKAKRAQARIERSAAPERPTILVTKIVPRTIYALPQPGPLRMGLIEAAKDPDQRVYLAGQSNSPEVLRAVYELGPVPQLDNVSSWVNSGRDIYMLLASNSATPPDILHALEKKSIPGEPGDGRIYLPYVLANSAVSVANRMRLAKDDPVRIAIVVRSAEAKESFFAPYVSDDKYINTVAGNSKAPLATLRRVAQEAIGRANESEVRNSLTLNPATPPDVLDGYAKSIAKERPHGDVFMTWLALTSIHENQNAAPETVAFIEANKDYKAYWSQMDAGVAINEAGARRLSLAHALALDAAVRKDPLKYMANSFRQNLAANPDVPAAVRRHLPGTSIVGLARNTSESRQALIEVAKKALEPVTFSDPEDATDEKRVYVSKSKRMLTASELTALYQGLAQNTVLSAADLVKIKAIAPQTLAIQTALDAGIASRAVAPAVRLVRRH